MWPPEEVVINLFFFHLIGSCKQCGEGNDNIRESGDSGRRNKFGSDWKCRRCAHVIGRVATRTRVAVMRELDMGAYEVMGGRNLDGSIWDVRGASI